MKISQNAVARIEYTLTNTTGEVLDSSEGGEPLAYLHGARNLIPGLEAELEGKGAGDAFEVTVPPEKAYGERHEAMVQDVPKDRMPPGMQVEAGMVLQAQAENGAVQMLHVVAVADDHVTVDGNHPLAGQTLKFDVKIVDVREATPEELEHGHVHGAGGHDH